MVPITIDTKCDWWFSCVSCPNVFDINGAIFDLKIVIKYNLKIKDNLQKFTFFVLHGSKKIWI